MIPPNINIDQISNEAKQSKFWFDEIRSLGVYIDYIALKVLFPSTDRKFTAADISKESNQVFIWLSEAYEKDAMQFLYLLTMRKNGIDPVYNLTVECETWKEFDCVYTIDNITLEDLQEIYQDADEETFEWFSDRSAISFLSFIENGIYEHDYRFAKLILLVEKNHAPLF